MLLEAEVYVYVENNEVYGFIGINEEHIERHIYNKWGSITRPRKIITRLCKGEKRKITSKCISKKY